MKTRTFVATCAIASLSLIVTSCKNEPPPPLMLNQNIAVILRSPTDTIGLQIANGILSAGMQYGLYANFLTATSLTDAEGQLSLIENLNIAAYSGVIIVPASPTALNSAIAELAAIIPVVVAGAPLAVTTPILCFVGTDNVAAGESLADALHKSIDQTDTVAMITVGNDPTASSRLFGFAARIQNLGHQSLTFEYDNGDNLSTQIEQLVTLTAPQIKAIVTSDPHFALVIASALRSAGRADIALVTFDAPHSVVEAIENGSIEGTMASDTYAIGYHAAMSIVSYIELIVPARTQYQAPMYLDADNISSAEAQRYINSI